MTIPEQDKPRKPRPAADAQPAKDREPAEESKGEDKAERTLGNHPGDPNSLAAKANFPPGVAPEAARDPGANIPSKPKTENQS